MALGGGHSEAFDWLMEALISAPVFAYPSFGDIVTNPFHLQTDASATALGMVLTQFRDGPERVIAFASRTMSAAERSYGILSKDAQGGPMNFTNTISGSFTAIIYLAPHTGCLLQYV